MKSLKSWALAAAVRAGKTFAQSALAVIVASGAITLGDVDWLFAFSAAALAAGLSVLTSIAGIPEVNDGESPLTFDDEFIPRD